MKGIILFSCLLGSCCATTPIPAGEIPVETFFRNYQYNEVRLSPDGNYLGVLAPDSNRVGLAVIDLKNHQANWAFADQLADVAGFRWATTSRLTFWLTHMGYSETGLMAVDRDGGRSVRLISPLYSGAQFLAPLPHSTNEFLVNSLKGATRPDSETLLLFPSVFRMDFYNGKMTPDVKNPGHVLNWLTDHNGVVRVGIGIYLTRVKIFYRSAANAPWETLADYDHDEYGLWPLGFAADNNTLFVSSYGDQDTKGIYTFDPKTKKILELGFRHAEADIGETIFSAKKQTLVGVVCETERPETFWFDPQYKRCQEAVDKVLTNTVNSLVSHSWDETKLIFAAWNDRTPGTYYLLDVPSMRLEKLFNVAEWINPDEMAEMKPIQYQARDGLQIHGYLTVPKGSSGTNLPLIVNPHGGPELRDNWGFDPEVQFLANRGYAVLRVNFRGSTGYGKSFVKAGFKEWGRKQQDDITDGVKWAIAHGIADPKRICIYGASYGGFAALTGLEQTPELYRCGISYAGVIDIQRNFKSVERNLKIVQAALADMLGEAKTEAGYWKEISPINHVDKIQVPVFLAYSEYDPKIPIATARDLAKALKKRGKLYDFMVKDNEAHGFHQEVNKIEFWKKVDEFLKANMQ